MNHQRSEELASARTGTWDWEVQTDRLRWSPQLSRIYGLAGDEAPNSYQHFLQRVYPADLEHTRSTVERALTERKDVEFQHRIVRADGAVRVLRSFVHVHRDDRGEVVRLSGACQDVTERDLLSDQMRQLQGLASAGSVAAGLSHDLNNVIGVLVLLCESLSTNGAARVPHAVDHIRQTARRASMLTTRIHRLARTSAANPPPLDLARTLPHIVDLLRDVFDNRVEVRLRVEPGVGHVRLDPIDLERVLWNLAFNARDAQPDGGVIELIAAPVDVVGPELTGDYCRITVRDEGTGMDEETAMRLFQPFFTTKGQRGTGLGLAVVHDIVDHAGGFVTVKSCPGSGTHIRVHLPTVDPNQP